MYTVIFGVLMFPFGHSIALFPLASEASIFGHCFNFDLTMWGCAVLCLISPIFSFSFCAFFFFTDVGTSLLPSADDLFVETSCGPVAHELKKHYGRFIKIDRDNLLRMDST